MREWRPKKEWPAGGLVGLFSTFLYGVVANLKAGKTGGIVSRKSLVVVTAVVILETLLHPYFFSTRTRTQHEDLSQTPHRGGEMILFGLERCHQLYVTGFFVRSRTI